MTTLGAFVTLALLTGAGIVIVKLIIWANRNDRRPGREIRPLAPTPTARVFSAKDGMRPPASKPPEAEPAFRSARLDALPTTPRIPLGRGKGFTFDIVGESFHQDFLHALDSEKKGYLGEKHVKFTALIVPEPDNPHDPNAILVCDEDGDPVGHFSRADAVRYAEAAAALAARGAVGACHAQTVGNAWQGTPIGVRLSLAAPDVLVERIRKAKARMPLT